jgi:hypothetical protein
MRAKTIKSSIKVKLFEFWFDMVRML